jgi:DNA-binding transcriptional ArsR family regulator
MSENAGDAFAAVADERRVRILRELWDAEDPLSFSELRKRVDVRDSGRFNYHLGELRGRFVEKDEDGYDLRYAGTKLVGSLYSGAYTEEASVGPVPVAGSCTHCGGDLEAGYEADRGYVDCTDCDVSVISAPVPPAFVDGREDDLSGALDDYCRTKLREVTAGFCTECSGPTVGRLGEYELGPRAVFECERCGGEFYGVAASVALDHTEVVSFYHDHGRDVRAIPLWELEWLDAAAFDGDCAVVTVALDDEELTLTIDEHLSVVGAERT